ncbi:hypothetical protein [Pseudomonas sp. BNK-43-a]|uniref:hypothetical protein n=1 Tax=unclassified Pseudomonas TaxID=196821 RepID=UPI0039BF8D97
MAITESTEISAPTVIAWGRLVLLGPEHNRLHEGLVRCSILVQGNNIIKQELTRPRNATCFIGDTEKVRALISPLINGIAKELSTTAEIELQSLVSTLNERGEVARKHALSLATERITAINKSIKDWQTRSADMQMQFAFDEDEQDQREQDFLALQRRLEQLRKERETEPKRQRDLYRVIDKKMYPVALEVILPKGATNGHQ